MTRMASIWLLLSLLQLYTAVLVNSQGCYWNVSYSSNTNNGIVKPGITTIGNCEQSCLNSPPCSAVDFNSNGDNSGNFCWFSQPGSNVNYGSTPGITHYTYVCPSSGATVYPTGFNSGASYFATNAGVPGGSVTGFSASCFWNASANSNSFGGNSQTQYKTLDSCQSACRIYPACYGVDWDALSISQQFCWFSMTPIINYNLVTGVTHYQYICAGDTANKSRNCWNMSADSYSPNGNGYSMTNLSSCQNSCKAGCYGIDWNPVLPANTINCWLSTNNIVLYGTSPGIYHFNYICEGNTFTVSGFMMSSMLFLHLLSKTMTSS